MRLYRRLLLAATLLAVIVIGLGAYVRLSDAGLGCPDWPGCYGHWLGVPDAEHDRIAAQLAFPQQPIDTGKAWKEMIHRYCAGALGLLILGISLLSWRGELRRRQSPVLPTLLLGIVGLQAALGMWTVTLLLKPVIVTLHLLGGMTTLALLVTLLLRTFAGAPLTAPPALRWLATLALLAVVLQIALGGWVSSNYAALACNGFPTCQGAWLPEMDLAHAFTVHRELGQAADGTLLSHAALVAVHWSHRLGALLVFCVVGALAGGLLRSRQARWHAWGWLLLFILSLQIFLGIANVLLALPLTLAVGHNLGAACLLSATLAIMLRLHQASAMPARYPATRQQALG